MSSSYLSIADGLKAARGRTGETKTAVAKAIGVTPSTYSSWEDGKTTPNDKRKLQKLEAHFGIDIYTLLGY